LFFVRFFQGEKFFREGGVEAKITRLAKDRLKELYSKSFLLKHLFSGLICNAFRFLLSCCKPLSFSFVEQVVAILYPFGAEGSKKPAKVIEPPVIKPKPVKIKYPIDDEEFWKSEAEQGRSCPPVPEADCSLDADRAQQLGIHPNCVLACPSKCMGRLLSNWFTTVNFRKFFSLPLTSLESFDIMVSSAATVHPVMRQLHISLLSSILKDRQVIPVVEKGRSSLTPPKPPIVQPVRLNVGVNNGDPDSDLGSFTQVFDNISESCEIKELSKFFEKYKDKDYEESKWTSCFVALENILKYDTVDTDKIASCFQVGDAWFEVLRVLMSEKANNCLSEYLDSLAECARILEIIALLPEALPFRFPVDPNLGM